MFRQGPVPVLVHGLLDYLVGIVLLAGPFVLDFDDDAAIATSIAAGVLLLVLAGASDLPAAFVRSIPRALHAIFDYVLAIAILVAPFVLGFTDDDTATAFLVAVAVVQIMQTIATRFLRPKDQPRPTA
jgi:predicted PurR-regulated permease PerM